MVLPLLESLSAAIGDELNELVGRLRTRLTQALRGEVVLQSAAGTLSASSVDGVTVTIATGTFTATIPTGTVFRLLSNRSGLAATTAVVSSRDSSTQITLSGAGVGAAFTSDSWELFTPAETVATVETTWGFPTSGRLVIDGTTFRYTGTTATTFTGLAHDDGTGTFVSGAPAAAYYLPATHVADGSLNTSVFDAYRRKFLLNYASGEALSVIGNNLGVPRPVTLQDSVYRELVKVAAYAPHGTLTAVRGILDAVLGSGNYDLLTDLTGGRGATSNVVGIRNPATIFIRADRAGVAPAARTFVFGRELLTVNSGLATATVAASYDANATSQPLAAPLARDPFTEHNVITSGANAYGAATTNSIVVLAPGGSFVGLVVRGDEFRIKTGPYAGRRYIIDSISTAGSLDQLVVRGILSGELIRPDTDVPVTFLAADWEIARPVSRVQFHLPSAELEPPTTGTAPTRASWEYVGTGTEGGVSAQLVTGTAVGSALSFAPIAAQTASYRRRARIDDSADWDVELQALFTDWGAASTTDHNQFGVLIDDGTRRFLIGVVRQTATTGTIQLAVSGSGLVGGTPSATTGTLAENVLHRIRISMRKNPARPRELTGSVLEIYVDDVRVQRVTAFGSPTASSPGVTPPGISFGVFSVATSAPQVLVRDVSWSIRPVRDYMNTTALASAGAAMGASAGGARTVDISPATDVAVGRHIRLAATVPNGSGGLGFGTWVFDTAASTSLGTVVGPTRPGAATGGLYANGIDLPVACDEVRYPLALGMSIELLDGADAGVYPITSLLGPDGTDLADSAGLAATTLFTTTNNAAAPASSAPARTVRVSGAPGSGFAAAAGLRWRLVPSFGDETGVPYTVAPTGSYAGTTLTLGESPNLLYSASYPIILGVNYSAVPTGQVLDPNTVVQLASASPVEYTYWPFYLYDGVGYSLRRFIEARAAAGVTVDFDRLFRDAAGLHVL